MDVSHGGVFNVRHGKRIVQTLAVPAQNKGGFGRSVDWGRLLLAREGSFKFSALSSSGGRNRQEQQTNQKYEHAGQPKCFKMITHRRFSFYDQYLARQPQRISNGLDSFTDGALINSKAVRVPELPPCDRCSICVNSKEVMEIGSAKNMNC